MLHFARRTAGYAGCAAAVVTAALLVTGCGDDDDSNSASTTSGMASMSMATGATSGASATVTTSGTAPTPSEAAGETTRIAARGGAQVTVSGDIYEKYVSAGGPAGPLGAPLEAEESAPNGGKYQDFVGGTIYEADNGDPHIVWGEIRKAWEDNGGADGKLGYPTTDETDIPGGKQSSFTGGTITWVDGQITVTPTA